MIRQYPLTPAAGKRLIAKALKRHPMIVEVLRSGRLIIVAGTTNGYLAEEILSQLGQAVGFSRRHFFRGVTVSPAWITAAQGRPPDNSGFPGDVVIDKGVWKRAKTIFDVAGDLGENDVIVKGANALDVASGHAANFVDHPDGGPMAAVLPAVMGRRAKLLIPVGLEKRVSGSLLDLANRLSASHARGPRLCPLPGQVFTSSTPSSSPREPAPSWLAPVASAAPRAVFGWRWKATSARWAMWRRSCARYSPNRPSRPKPRKSPMARILLSPECFF